MEYDVGRLRFTERKRKGQKGQKRRAYGSFFYQYCLRRHDGESSAVPNCIRMCQAEKTKKTGMLIEIAPFAPQESGSGQLPKRSEAIPSESAKHF